MQKIQRGEIEQRVQALRERLLTAVDLVDDDLLQQPETIGEHSIGQILGFLGLWSEATNKGLREVQRRKKPTDLLRWHEDNRRFFADAVSETAHEDRAELLERLEDGLFQFEARMEQLSYDDLNRPKRIRFLGNKPLWPLIASLTYEHDEPFVEQIERFVARANN